MNNNRTHRPAQGAQPLPQPPQGYVIQPVYHMVPGVVPQTQRPAQFYPQIVPYPVPVMPHYQAPPIMPVYAGSNPYACSNNNATQALNANYLAQRIGNDLHLGSGNATNQLAVGYSNKISFNLNGKQITITDPDPKMTLNEYLRSLPGHTGTKISCGEGGCGACTVMVTTHDATLNKLSSHSINSCLRPLCAVDGASVTTVEAVGSQRNGFHPIQERLADNNGSQCGYCSAGMVMSMYSLLQSNPKPSSQDIEEAFDGNLCRCTGYRPILASMRTFACDNQDNLKKCNPSGTCCSKHFYPDIEDLSIPKYEPYQHVNKVPYNFTPPHCLRVVKDGISWFTPITLKDLYTLLDQYATTQVVKLVVGNTSAGIYKEDNPTIIIDIRNIPDLKMASIDSTGCTVGAAVTMTDLMELLTQWSGPQTSSFPILVDHLKKVGNRHVRNAASWVGGVMLTHDHDDFPSDVFTCLLTVGATLTIGSSKGLVSLSMSDFLSYNMIGKVVLSVRIPFTNPNERVKTYKVSLRHQNAHAIVNAGFRVEVNPSTLVVQSQPTIVFGGISTHSVRMSKTEQYFIGKRVTDMAVMQGAFNILQQELVPSPGPGRIQYRVSLATSLFYKFYASLLPSNMVKSSLTSLTNPFVRPISSGSQSYQTDPSEYPVSQPMPKLKSKLQASGEVRYTGDITVPANTLYGAFVLSTVASATLTSIDPSAALNAPGVVGFVSAKDIIGENNCGPVIPDEEIFVSSNVLYHGQAIGLIVADTQRHANEAAKLVNATYANQKKPILTMEDAIAANSIYPNYPEMPISPVISGNIDTGFSQSDHIISGSVSAGGQYHFHMETLTCVAIPQEDSALQIYATTQWATSLQSIVSQATGIPCSKVTVTTPAMGGGFGGKICKTSQVAAAAAVASGIYQSPVKVCLDLNNNMEMIGKRNPMLCQYKIGFTKDGKLKAVHFVVYCDGGCAIEFSPGTVAAALTCIDNTYYCPNFKGEGFVCRTNMPSHTAMRGPGWVTSIFFMEHCIEHIAKFLQVDSNTIRELNFYTEGQVTPYGQQLPYYNIPTMWEAVKVSGEYVSRRALVDSYNSGSRWVKKGLGLVPVKFGLAWSPIQYGVLLNIYQDGTVMLTHGGVEIGQGIDTKVAQVVAYQLGIPVGNIVVAPASTTTLPNTTGTGGSVTSELNSLAAINACQIINERLSAIRQTLPSNSTWEQVIAAAFTAGIDLQAKGWINPPASPYGPWLYNSYVVACSEVLVDILTGEIQILRSDLLFDCGKSLNPAIDIGQVEGGYVQGLGYYFTEELTVDPDGQLTSNGTWEYKPPSSMDIPIDFRITLLKNAPNPVGVLGSKGSGEPPLAAAASVYVAVKHAIDSARTDMGNSDFCTLNLPATVEAIQSQCLVTPSQFFI